MHVNVGSSALVKAGPWRRLNEVLQASPKHNGSPIHTLPPDSMRFTSLTALSTARVSLSLLSPEAPLCCWGAKAGSSPAALASLLDTLCCPLPECVLLAVALAAPVVSPAGTIVGGSDGCSDSLALPSSVLPPAGPSSRDRILSASMATSTWIG